jgi:hypothetical protein
MKIKEFRKTCQACPSQWEGETEDGKEIYVRYRHGHLTIDVGNPKVDYLYRNTIIFEKQIGDNLDGVMTEEELKPYLKEAGFDL